MQSDSLIIIPTYNEKENISKIIKVKAAIFIKSNPNAMAKLIAKM